MKVLVACESSGVVRDAFIAKGHDAVSCDLLPCPKGGPHYCCDVLAVLDRGWDLMIAHPPCTYLTVSAAWAFADPDFEKYPGVGYHQQVEPGTLTGAARRKAREEALEFVKRLYDCDIPRVAIENPIGNISSLWRGPDQIIQPWMFGEDASKGTCLWLKGLPRLRATKIVRPRDVGGRPRWANQTDGGQNKLSPSDDRWQLRSMTYPGIAAAMAEQWSSSRIYSLIEG